MTKRKQYLTIALTLCAIAITAILFMGCAGPQRIQQLNCVDFASASGHAYEHIWGEDVTVCIGKRKMTSEVRHAQACFIKGEHKTWIGIRSGHLVLNVPCELKVIEECMTLVEFDKKMRWRLK